MLALERFALATGLLLLGNGQLASARRGPSANYPTDPNAADDCSWWFDYTTSMPCDNVLSNNFITMEQFRAWNPSIGPKCEGMTVNRSYCVESMVVPGEPEQPPPTKTTTLVTSTTKRPSPTSPGNGIQTPEPIQPDMVGNCNKFRFVKPGTSCNDILDENNISLQLFFKWNPSVTSTCSGLWAEVNVCVSVIGYTPTPTDPGNGIETPLPTQPSMVGNCNKFYKVKANEGCAAIASKNNIPLAKFLQWNPKAGNSCAGLWADTYACVRVIGYTPTPTNPGNGIETPSPIQGGMVKNCKKFHFVKKDQTCVTIQKQYKVTLSNLVKWNPAIGAQCRSLWTNTHLCVGV